MRRACLIGPLTLVAVASCSWNRFDDLSQSAPVYEISPAGDFRPASFGDAVVGLKLPWSQPGGMVVSVGNGDATLTTAEFSGSGTPVLSGASVGDLERLGRPTRLEAVTEGPSGPSPAKMPMVWVAGGEAIHAVDALVFHSSWDTPRSLRYQSSWGAQPSQLGLSLATVDLGGSSRADLVAGAGNALVLLRLDEQDLPDVAAARVLVESDGFPGPCRALATGQLESGKVAVAVGMPERNTVRVLMDAAGCVDTVPCESVALDAPADAKGFGTALAFVGDTLVVGAPGSSQVFVYRFAGTSFTATVTISAPPGAGNFGAALAALTLPSNLTLLAAAAPMTPVDGVADAGAVYLYDLFNSAAMVGSLGLASPRAGGMLGRRLAVVPFLRPGESAPRALLAAAGLQGVYVFFADLITNLGDVRRP